MPELLVGGLIIRRGGFSGLGKVGLIFGVVIFAWWVFLSGKGLDSAELKSLEPKPKAARDA